MTEKHKIKSLQNSTLNKFFLLTMEQIKLYKLASYLLDIGYYSTYDFQKYLTANGINIF